MFSGPCSVDYLWVMIFVSFSSNILDPPLTSCSLFDEHNHLCSFHAETMILWVVLISLVNSNIVILIYKLLISKRVENNVG